MQISRNSFVVNPLHQNSQSQSSTPKWEKPRHGEQNSAYDFPGSMKAKAGERKSKAKKRRHTYNLTYQNRSNYKKFLLMGLLVTCAV